MFVKNRLYTGANKWVLIRPVIWSIYSVIIAYLFINRNLDLAVPMAFLAVIGTAISLFLSFRTNSAYARWWEARKVWGEIVNNSRTLARQVLLFGQKNEGAELRQKMVQYQIAWCWNLAYGLRKKGWSQEGKKYLDIAEREKIKQSSNIPNEILFQQQKHLAELENSNMIDAFDRRRIDETLKQLCDSMGKSERIKNTVFPTQYSLFTIIFINLFLLLLPLGLVEHLGYYTVLAQTAVGFTFGMIQNIAVLMQDPFENKPNDTPMFALSRTIEINLLEMCGETELPEKKQPVNGVLM